MWPRHPVPEPGDIIDNRWVVRAILGRGGQGTVYAVEDRATGARHALKVIPLGHAQAEARLDREARALSAVRHPNIVAFTASGRLSDGSGYILMDLVDGSRLSSFYESAAATMSQRLDWLEQVAMALAELHASGIGHRDVKPENILVNEDGAAILVDLGVVLLPDADTLTREGQCVGTPKYLPPEVLRGEVSSPTRIDGYALGVVAFELLTSIEAFRVGAELPASARAAAALAQKSLPLDRSCFPPVVPVGVVDAVLALASPGGGSPMELAAAGAALSRRESASRLGLAQRAPRTLWSALGPTARVALVLSALCGVGLVLVAVLGAGTEGALPDAATMAEQCGPPIVERVFPLGAKRGVATRFTATGHCLPQSTKMWIGRCRDIRQIAYEPEAVVFECTPDYRLGNVDGTVKDGPDGEVLWNFLVNVSADLAMKLEKCPDGSGDYCGEALGGETKGLYTCAGGAVFKIEDCASSCERRRPSAEDRCSL